MARDPRVNDVCAQRRHTHARHPSSESVVLRVSASARALSLGASALRSHATHAPTRARRAVRPSDVPKTKARRPPAALMAAPPGSGAAALMMELSRQGNALTQQVAELERRLQLRGQELDLSAEFQATLRFQLQVRVGAVAGARRPDAALAGRRRAVLRCPTPKARCFSRSSRSTTDAGLNTVLGGCRPARRRGCQGARGGGGGQVARGGAGERCQEGACERSRRKRALGPRGRRSGRRRRGRAGGGAGGGAARRRVHASPCCAKRGNTAHC